MTEQPKYPLVEAVAEIALPPEWWSEDKYSEFKSAVEPGYPVYRTTKPFNLGFQIGPGGHQTAVKETTRHQFFTKDDIYVVQIDPSLLAVNNRNDYRGWESFSLRIADALVTLNAIQSVDTFPSVTMHYLNRIVVPGSTAKVDEYLDFRPAGDDDIQECSVTVVVPWNEESSVIIKHMSITAGEQPSMVVALNLSAKRPNVASADVLKWFGTAHERTNAEFHRSVTEKTLLMYDAWRKPR